VTIDLKPEQEQIIRQQLASGLYGSVEEVLDTALASLPNDARFDPKHRREAVRRMIDFGERRKLSLGEPVTRQFLHEGHLL
jgi:Arc/MetJ-type ribon-helix-helix transcriptional regulator